jgi:ribosomal protein S20
MPILKSSKKKMRRDKKITLINDEKKKALKGLIKNMRRTPNKDSFSSVMSGLDKAAKHHLIPLNRASRLKSRLSKLLITSK